MSRFSSELYAKRKAEPPAHRYALLTVMVIAVALRVANLDYPIRIDEKITLTFYVTRPWIVALSDYSLPNNHLFHTALAKASTGLFGISLWALLLPALIAGVLVVPATYIATRSLNGPRGAMTATGHCRDVMGAGNQFSQCTRQLADDAGFSAAGHHRGPACGGDLRSTMGCVRGDRRARALDVSGDAPAGRPHSGVAHPLEHPAARVY